MIINSNTLPDPADFTIDDIVGTTEETLLSGDRRYIKSGKIKKNIQLQFRGIDDSDKGTIETVALSTSALSMTLDGKNYTVVSYSGPKFTRMKGQEQLYQCDWELREA
jgi:hypothetical protein